jgi:phosphate uptake regulator
LKAAVADERIIKEIGLDNPRDCLGYRLITKSVERVSDHAVRMAQNIITVRNPVTEEVFKAFREMSTHALSGFEDSINALFSKDYALADEVVERMEQIEDFEKKVIVEILKKNFDAEMASSLRLIIESVKRTAEYGSDIAEVVLNLTILTKKE